MLCIILILFNFLIDETKREKDFYLNHGIVCPKDMLSNNEHVSTNKLAEDDVNDADLHRLDEQVFLCKMFFFVFNIQYLIKIFLR